MITIEKNNLENKEISLLLTDGDKIQGVVTSLNGDLLNVAKNGNWEDLIELNINDVIKLKHSKYPYFDLKHKADLRESKIPLLDFRYTKEQLEKLLNCYVLVNYDGKIIEGKIIEYYSSKNKEGYKNIIFIIENKNEIKDVADYRLRSLEILGKTELEYKKNILFRKVESNVREIYDEEYYSTFDEFDCQVKDPDDTLDDYFKDRINALEGKEVDFDKYVYNWSLEVVSRKDLFYENSGDKKLYEEFKEARQVTEYYKKQKEFINLVFDVVENLKSLPDYGQDPQKTKIEILKYLYNSNIIEQ